MQQAWPLAWRALVASAALASVGWLVAIPPVPPRNDAAPARLSPPPPPTAARIAESYPRLAAAPLFWPDRTPWQPPAPATMTEAVSDALAGYVAVGVMISGDTRQALVRTPHAARTQALTEGELVEGWTLRHITREALVFTSQAGRFEMPIGKRSDTRP